MIEPKIIRYEVSNDFIIFKEHGDFFIEPETDNCYSALVIVIDGSMFRSIKYADYGCTFHQYLSDRSYRMMPKEEFISVIQASRPECFEWLLFHPEWM